VHKGSPSKDDDLHLSGLTSTAGGLVFASEDKTFYALDSSDGKLLWSFPAGARITASAVSFEVGGEQLVSIAAGRDLLTFGLVGAK
jgi:outer membrane protein assembly factor BamB